MRAYGLVYGVCAWVLGQCRRILSWAICIDSTVVSIAWREGRARGRDEKTFLISPREMRKPSSSLPLNLSHLSLSLSCPSTPSRSLPLTLCSFLSHSLPTPFPACPSPSPSLSLVLPPLSPPSPSSPAPSPAPCSSSPCSSTARTAGCAREAGSRCRCRWGKLARHGWGRL